MNIGRYCIFIQSISLNISELSPEIVPSPESQLSEPEPDPDPFSPPFFFFFVNNNDLFQDKDMDPSFLMHLGQNHIS